MSWSTCLSSCALVNGNIPKSNPLLENVWLLIDRALQVKFRSAKISPTRKYFGFILLGTAEPPSKGYYLFHRKGKKYALKKKTPPPPFVLCWYLRRKWVFLSFAHHARTMRVGLGLPTPADGSVAILFGRVTTSWLKQIKLTLIFRFSDINWRNFCQNCRLMWLLFFSNFYQFTNFWNLITAN